MSLFGLIGQKLGLYLYGIDVSTITDWSTIEAGNAIRIFALMASLGGFAFGSWMFGTLVTREPVAYFRLRPTSSLKMLGLTLFLFCISVPVINLLVQWNDWLAGSSGVLDDLQTTNVARKQAMLLTPTMGSMWLNLLAMAVVPAVGEELFFRGIILRYGLQLTKNMHVSVWLSAIVFTVVHLEYLNAFPILFMGLLLGYLYVYSGSIWWNVLLHFLNNAMIVLIHHFRLENGPLKSILEYGSSGVGAYVAIGLLALCGWLVFRAIQKGFWNEMKGSLMRD